MSCQMKKFRRGYTEAVGICQPRLLGHRRLRAEWTATIKWSPNGA